VARDVFIDVIRRQKQESAGDLNKKRIHHRDVREVRGD